MKIFDCFPFFNELDLLDLRLTELNPYVDYFVLVEARYTHSGLKKELFFENNKDRFIEFLPKIKHIIIDEFPEFNIQTTTQLKRSFRSTIGKFIPEKLKTKFRTRLIKNPNYYIETRPHWLRENFQRNAIMQGIIEANPDDLILISDIDEIPNPNTLVKVKEETGPLVFRQTMYMYFLDCYSGDNWHGTVLLKRKLLGELNPQYYRNLRDILSAIDNGGWHFSYMGGIERVITKIRSYAEIQNNIEINNQPEYIKKLLIEGINVHNTNERIKFVEIDNTYPNSIEKILKKYPYLHSNSIKI